MTDYKAQYLLYCNDLNHGYTKADVKRHNSAMKELGKLFQQLQSESDHRAFLFELLQNEVPQTRALAAAHCLGLGVYISEATKVLRKLAKNKMDPFLAFEAQSTLEVWKQQGYLTF